MADYAGGRNTTANVLTGAAVIGGLVLFMWASNKGYVDMKAMLWSKPGRTWAVYAGAAAAVVVIFGGMLFTRTAQPAYAAGAFIVVALAFYGLGLGATVTEKLGSPVECKKGYIATGLDLTCEKTIPGPPASKAGKK